jgi:hypothetical protein
MHSPFVFLQQPFGCGGEYVHAALAAEEILPPVVVMRDSLVLTDAQPHE